MNLLRVCPRGRATSFLRAGGIVACVLLAAGCQLPRFESGSSSMALPDDGALELTTVVDPGNYTVIEAFVDVREIPDEDEHVVEGERLVGGRRRDPVFLATIVGSGPPAKVFLRFRFPASERPQVIAYQWTVVYRLPSGSDRAEVSSQAFVTGFKWIAHRPLGQVGGDSLARE